jgi:hypothetical protein
VSLEDFINDDQPQEQVVGLPNDDDDDDDNVEYMVKSWRCDVCSKVFDSYKMMCIHEAKCVGNGSGCDGEKDDIVCVEVRGYADEGEARGDAVKGQREDGDGCKHNRNGWTWVQQVSTTSLIGEVTERPIDWGRLKIIDASPIPIVGANLITPVSVM